MALGARGWIRAAFLLLLAGLVAGELVRILLWFYAALPFPLGIDYNEGIVWKQMNEIVAGRGYAPIDGFPAIVFHYPPVFHLAAAALAWTGLDPLLAGRLVSLLATIGSTVLVGDFARRLIPDDRASVRTIAAASAIIIFLLFEPVHFWAPQMRVDAIACFFALAGMWCIATSDPRPRIVLLAAVFFVLSVFSKQVSIVAPAAAFGALLLLRPRRAVPAIATTVLLGTVILAILVWHTDGGVLRHLFLYNINRFDFSRLLVNLREGTNRVDAVLVLTGIAGYVGFVVRTWRTRRRRADAGKALDLAMTSMLLFVPIATLSLLATGKFGSSSAYYIQWMAGLAVFGGFAIASMLKRSSDQLGRGSPIRAAAWGIVPLAIAAFVAFNPDADHRRMIEAFGKRDRQIIALIEPVQGYIISDDMVILLRTGRDVVWEPAIFAELARSGVWDEQLVVKAFQDGRIGAAVTDGDRGFKWFDEHYNPVVLAAMDQALPRKIIIGGRVVHLPAQQTGQPTR